MAGPQSILNSTTDAANSSVFQVGTSPVTIAIHTNALAGAETVTIERLDSSGAWAAVVDALRGALVIAAGETTVPIYDSGTYRAAKTATAAAVGIEQEARLYA